MRIVIESSWVWPHTPWTTWRARRKTRKAQERIDEAKRLISGVNNPSAAQAAKAEANSYALASGNQPQKKGFIGSNWKAIFLIGTIIMGTISLVGFAQFMYEEGAQQAGFGTFQCFNALKLADSDEETQDILKTCLKQIEIARQIGDQGEWFTNTLGWINPINWNSYVVYWKGFKSNIDTNEKLITFMAEKIEKKLSSTPYVKMCDVYTYEYQVWQYEQNKMKTSELQAKLDNMTSNDWSIKESYTKIDKKVWFTVIIFQHIIVTQEPCI